MKAGAGVKVEGGCERGGWGHERGTQRWVWMGAKAAVCRAAAPGA